MHPPDCPSWEYDHHPDRHKLLVPRCIAAVDAVRRGKPFSTDPRPQHAELFRGLTPPGMSYYAGNYRGAAYKCLRYRQVGIENDPRVGARPDAVAGAMASLEAQLEDALKALDLLHADPHVPARDKLYTTCLVACQVFEWFLRIHPFVNGNGHAGRLMVVGILGRYGYWMQNWTVEPRPRTIRYGDMILLQRAGNPVFCADQMMADVA